MSDVDFYIMKFPPEVQRRLIEIRFTALDIFQNVHEKIHYGMPVFVYDDRGIMYYAAYKNHIAIHIGYNWKDNWEARGNALMDYLKKRYLECGYTKFTIQIPHNDDFCGEMIEDICELLWQDREVYRSDEI